MAHPVKNRESEKTANLLVLTTPNKSGVRGRVGECRVVALAERQGGYRQCQRSGPRLVKLRTETYKGERRGKLSSEHSQRRLSKEIREEGIGTMVRW